jgi:thiopurine S-methyltransferase
MDHEFWHQRWRDNLIGFHQEAVNPHLQEYWERLGVPPDATVFVPLCGKSLDMVWLAERHRVLGVELSPKAVEDFFKEQGLQPQRRSVGPFSICEAGSLTLYCGDFFDLQPAHTAAVTAIYDRAALIALPQPLRASYAQKLAELAPAGTAMLVVTLEYEQSQMNGPPFSVEPAEVMSLFDGAWRIESLHRESILENEPRFRERGLSRLAEHSYLLVRQ